MSVKSPNFTDATFKAIHLTSGHSVEYEMPGNMTSDFNYDKRYKEESDRSLSVDVSGDMHMRRTRGNLLITLMALPGITPPANRRV